MMWKPLKFTVFSSSLSLLGQNWLTGWNSAGTRNFRDSGLEPLPCIRQEQDDWVDFFIGSAQASEVPCQSILDGSAKVGLHYCKGDLGNIAFMHCPAPDIPSYLWQSLQEQHSL